MRFRIEAWRIIKYLLITAVVNVPLALLHGAVTNALVASQAASAGTLLTVQSYAHLLINTLLLTVLHRYFTFRATEPWFIAVPLMLLAALAWQLLKGFALTTAASSGQEALRIMSNGLAVTWFVLQYLLQRCVIYCHTTDRNGWYRRFHPDTKENES